MICNWYGQEVFDKANEFRKLYESKDIEAYRSAALALRKEMVKLDGSYPKYHFAAPEGWIGTPDVYLKYKGLYHVFYQYVPTLPDGRVAGAFGVNNHIPNNHMTLSWGHAVSEDLIHWKDMPTAIWPEEDYEYLYRIYWMRKHGWCPCESCCKIRNADTRSDLYCR